MELALLGLLILINGLLSMSEIAVVSSRRVRLRQAAERGEAGAAAALDLAESPTRFLSTVQVGITLVAVLSGFVGERAIGEDLARWLGTFEGVAEFARPIASVVTIAIITYVSLVLGELVPKRLGMSNPEGVAAIIARPMQLLSRLGAPLVAFLTFSTDLLLRVLGRRLPDDKPVTQEEIEGMIEAAADTGVLERVEQTLVERVFRLGERQAKALMVPRTEIEWLEAGDPIDRIKVAIATAVHSHFPVCRGGLDDIVGVVHVKDVVRSLMVSEELDLTALSRPPMYVPETTPAIKLLETFKRSGGHLAFVVDEYGGIEGLITLNDVVGAIVGEMSSATGERGVELAVRRRDGSWLLSGSLPLDRLRTIMGTQTLPKEGETDYQTLGGMVLAHLGHIPETAEAFAWERWRFEVMDMDGPRVDKVLLTIGAAREGSPGDGSARDGSAKGGSAKGGAEGGGSEESEAAAG